MNYFNKAGVMVSYIPKEFLGQGSQGVVFIPVNDDSICVKTYTSSKPEQPKTIFDDYETRLSEDMFDYLKSEGNQNVCQLNDLLFDTTQTDVAGYVARYYETKVKNILMMPIEYLLENFNSLYEVMNKFAYDLVRVVDFIVKI